MHKSAKRVARHLQQLRRKGHKTKAQHLEENLAQQTTHFSGIVQALEKDQRQQKQAAASTSVSTRSNSPLPQKTADDSGKPSAADETKRFTTTGSTQSTTHSMQSVTQNTAGDETNSDDETESLATTTTNSAQSTTQSVQSMLQSTDGGRETDSDDDETESLATNTSSTQSTSHSMPPIPKSTAGDETNSGGKTKSLVTNSTSSFFPSSQKSKQPESKDEKLSWSTADVFKQPLSKEMIWQLGWHFIYIFLGEHASEENGLFNNNADFYHSMGQLFLQYLMKDPTEQKITVTIDAFDQPRLGKIIIANKHKFWQETRTAYGIAEENLDANDINTQLLVSINFIKTAFLGEPAGSQKSICCTTIARALDGFVQLLKDAQPGKPIFRVQQNRPNAETQCLSDMWLARYPAEYRKNINFKHITSQVGPSYTASELAQLRGFANGVVVPASLSQACKKALAQQTYEEACPNLDSQNLSAKQSLAQYLFALLVNYDQLDERFNKAPAPRPPTVSTSSAPAASR